MLAQDVLSNFYDLFNEGKPVAKEKIRWTVVPVGQLK